MTLALIFLLAQTWLPETAGAAAFEETDTQFELDLDSKKGLQGDYILTEEGVTGDYVLLNLFLDMLISPVETAVGIDHMGETYYFNPVVVSGYQYRLMQARTKNVHVTLVILMRGDEYCASLGMMAAGPDSTKEGKFYALNPDCPAVEATFRFLGRAFARYPTAAYNFILENEVNMPEDWNYTGNATVEEDAELYARTFLIFWKSLITEGNWTTRAFISLDHSWTADEGGKGFPGKTFLQLFNAYLRALSTECTYHIAYHLYPPILNQTSSIWTRPDLCTSNEDTPYISPSNLSVLTGYVRNHVGPATRILLSEQGFDAGEGETVQAAGLAYCYYAALKEPMVEAAIFRSYKDEGTDGGLDLGLIKRNGTPREAFDVYQKMDTNRGLYVMARYLTKIRYEWKR